MLSAKDFTSEGFAFGGREIMKNKDKIILDLCGGTGAWSRPYKEAGYDVKNITLPDYNLCDLYVRGEKNYNLVSTKKVWELVGSGDVYGILAAPPCTMFSLARTKANRPRDLKKGFEVVRACLNIIWSCMGIQQDTKKKTLPLKFWALENPNGMLKYFLGKPAFEFNPYEFGDGYKKRTMLWGWFNEPRKTPIKSSKPKFDKLKTREIAPEMFGKLTRQERRAITPKGFAEAFFRANQ